MATNFVVVVLSAFILAIQGAVIHEKDSNLLVSAISTLLTNPETLIASVGQTREKRTAEGAWDFDHSFGGATLQVKYKDPANRWKGGHAHFEAPELQNLRSRNVNFNVTFDGGAAPWDGMLNLIVEYTLQHAIEERGIFELSRRHDGNQWISDVSNKQNGGEDGSRIFPLMEFQIKTDHSTISTATYNSNRFKNMKLEFKIDPGEKLNMTLAGNVLGQAVTIALHGTRNSTINTVNGTLNVEIGNKKYSLLLHASQNKVGQERQVDMKLTGDVDGRPLEVTFAGKRQWTQFSGNFTFALQNLHYKLDWSIDRSNGMNVSMKVDSSLKPKIILDSMNSMNVIKPNWIEYLVAFLTENEIKFSSTTNWDMIKLRLKVLETEIVDIQVKTDITGDLTGKTMIDYKVESKLFPEMAGPGEIIGQVEEVDANTKNLTIKIDNVKQFEVTFKDGKGINTNEIDFTIDNIDYKIPFLYMDMNGDGEKDHLSVGVIRNRSWLIRFEVDRSRMPQELSEKIIIKYPAQFAFLTHAAGTIAVIHDRTIDGTEEHEMFKFLYKPGPGHKDLEIIWDKYHKNDSGKSNNNFDLRIQRNKEVYYGYTSIVNHEEIPSEVELFAVSDITVNNKSVLHTFACSPVINAFNVLCFKNRKIISVLKVDKYKPYKMDLSTTIEKDGSNVFEIYVDTKTSPYAASMRAIIAPHSNDVLRIAASLDPGTTLKITSNIQGFSHLTIIRMPNGQRRVSLNDEELFVVDFQQSGRSITQNITLPDGSAFTTTFKWGSNTNWIKNNIEFDLNGTERMFCSKLGWNLGSQSGNWTLDVVGKSRGWGDYSVHRTGNYANSNGVWTLDVNGTALWKGKNVETDVFIQLDTHKVGNGKLDAITAKLVKVVDGNKYEVNVTDGKMPLGDLVKIGAFFSDFS